jgi:hypothetical protein
MVFLKDILKNLSFWSLLRKIWLSWSEILDPSNNTILKCYFLFFWIDDHQIRFSSVILCDISFDEYLHHFWDFQTADNVNIYFSKSHHFSNLSSRIFPMDKRKIALIGNTCIRKTCLFKSCFFLDSDLFKKYFLNRM